MKVHFFQPAADLKDYILYYWSFQAEFINNATPAVISPSGFPELIFNLGAPVLIDFDGSKSTSAPLLQVAGQITRPITVHMGTSCHYLCIKLKPYSLRALFNINSSELTNKSTDISDINPEAYRQLQNTLTRADSDYIRIRLIEEYLRKLFRKNDSSISQSTKEFVNLLYSGSFISNNKITQTENLRSFQRNFKKDVGFSPKMLQRIVRFNKAYFLKRNNPDLPLQDIAFMCGYYDLSHLVNEFREFSGQPPYEYFTEEDEIMSLFAGIKS